MSIEYIFYVFFELKTSIIFRSCRISFNSFFGHVKGLKKHRGLKNVKRHSWLSRGSKLESKARNGTFGNQNVNRLNRMPVRKHAGYTGILNDIRHQWGRGGEGRGGRERERERERERRCYYVRFLMYSIVNSETTTSRRRSFPEIHRSRASTDIVNKTAAIHDSLPRIY